MKKLGNKIKVLILSLILLIISALVIIINGKTYIVKIENYSLNEISNIDEIKVKLDKDNVVKCVNKKKKTVL